MSGDRGAGTEERRSGTEERGSGTEERGSGTEERGSGQAVAPGAAEGWNVHCFSPTP
jgi:serine/threonine-protein kinase